MYKNILFPVDITETGSWKESLPVVLEYMEAFEATLHIMTVVSNGRMSLVQQYFPQGSAERIIAKMRVALEKFVGENIPKKYKVKNVVATGSVYECIIKTAEKAKVDLIVMSAHRPELKDYLLGPNAAKVVRHSNCSVLVVRK